MIDYSQLIFKSLPVCESGINTKNEVLMKKAYGIVVYESISDEAKLQAYVELAPKAFDKYGAKFLTRGYPSVLKENARNERTVVVEFPSVEQAEAFYESDEYQLALEALGDGAVRSYKVCEAF